MASLFQANIANTPRMAILSLYVNITSMPKSPFKSVYSLYI